MGGLIEVEVARLAKAPWNYRLGDSEMQRKLVANMRRAGQVENLIVRRVDGGFEVVNGNHRLDAIVELGWKTVTAWDLGEVSTEEAIRLAVETNETRFKADQVKLAEAVYDIREEYGMEDLEESMPFAEGELEQYAALLEFDWSQYGAEKPEGTGRTSVQLEPGVHGRLKAVADGLGVSAGRALELVVGGGR